MTTNALTILQPAAPPPSAMPALSQSMYESMACPASYQAIYIHGAESPSGPLAELSNEIHAAMKLYAEHLRASGRSEDWAYLEEIMRPMSGEARGILGGFIGSMQFDPRTILSTELRIIFDDIAGTPDLVTMETPVDATIWDYKNYFEIIDADTFQSKLYPLLLFRHNPSLESVRFVLVFMRYGATREVVWTRDQVPFLEKTIADARARQRAIHEVEGLAEAIPGRACEYCPLLRTARCQVNAWNPRAVMTPAERLRHVLFLRASLATSTEILHEHAREQVIEAADENGRTYRARYTARVRRMLPVAATLDVLKVWLAKTGEDLLPKALISQTSLRSLRNAKKRADLNRMLREIEAEKIVPSFKIDRVDPEVRPDDDDESEEA